VTAATNLLVDTMRAYRTNAAVYRDRNAGKGQRLFDRFAARLEPASRVLDAGCGPGRDLARFAVAGHRPTEVDLCPEFAAMAAAHGPVVVADVRALPFADASFDAVWACASLVHLSGTDVGVALAEFRRVARGPVLVSVKGDGSPGWREDAVGLRWFNTWTAGRLAAGAVEAGLRVDAVEVGAVWVDLWAVA
jgi:SAM-dependent methyltransferase